MDRWRRVGLALQLMAGARIHIGWLGMSNLARALRDASLLRRRGPRARVQEALRGATGVALEHYVGGPLDAGRCHALLPAGPEAPRHSSQSGGSGAPLP